MSELMNFRSDHQRNLLGFLFLLQNGIMPKWLPEYDQPHFEEIIVDAFRNQPGFYKKNMAGKITGNEVLLESWVNLLSDNFKLKVLTALNEAAGRGILIFKAIVENKLRIFLATGNVKSRFDLMFWNYCLTRFAEEDPGDKQMFYRRLEDQIEKAWWDNYQAIPADSYKARINLMQKLTAQYSSC